MDIFFYVALILTSIVALTFIIERGMALRSDMVVPPPVAEAVQSYQSPGDVRVLQATCEQYPSPLSRLLLFAIEHLGWPKSENSQLLETRARHEVVRLDRGLVVLEIIVGIAPLLGLVGTIYGLIVLFGSWNQDSAMESARFAQGISLALRATLMGLLIAIPTLIGWSYYNKKVETLSVEMESLCDEFLRKYYGNEEVEPARIVAAVKGG